VASSFVAMPHRWMQRARTEKATAALRPAAPQIVLLAACNTRRFCVWNLAERCANDFLP